MTKLGILESQDLSLSGILWFGIDALKDFKNCLRLNRKKQDYPEIKTGLNLSHTDNLLLLIILVF
jgi:hypothetical protein